MDSKRLPKSDPQPPAPLSELALQRYIDGRLDAAEQERLQEILKADPASRRRLDALREEDRLLGGALEKRAEPPIRIAEKVMTSLYGDYNRRLAILRARRLRNRIVFAVSAAALVMLAVLTLQPRAPAGILLSSRGVSVLRTGTERLTLEKLQRFYPGDVLVTAAGQFARLQLRDGSLLDLEELGRIRVEAAGEEEVRIAWESGRLRVKVGEACKDFQLVAGGFKLRGAAKDEWELSHPVLARTQPPRWAQPWRAAPASESVRQDPGRDSLLGLLVSAGFARLLSLQTREMVELAAPQLAVLDPSTRKVRESLPIAQRLPRSEAAWIQVAEAGPQSRACLGLIQNFDWPQLGSQLGLLRDLPDGQAAEEAMRGAFQTLAGAMRQSDPLRRAASLSAGHQALRTASEHLVLSDARRWSGRLLEGLILYERGRTLLALGTPAAFADARTDFKDAVDYLEEALSGDPTEKGMAMSLAPGLASRPAPRIHSASRLSELDAPEQALLLARFYQPWARYHYVLLAGESTGPALPGEADPGQQLEEGFRSALEICGPSLETLGARYGLGLVLARARRTEDAENVLRDLATTTVAGLSGDALAQAEGLRQAALVELARLFASGGRMDQALGVRNEFRIRYILDWTSPPALEMERLAGGR